MSHHDKDFGLDGQTINGNNNGHGRRIDSVGDGRNVSSDPTLHHVERSGTNVTISSELFEQLYLQPKVRDPAGLKHPLQKLFGNPTPLGIIGFELSLTPITMRLMEWRQAGGGDSFQNATCIFYGGVLLWIAGIFEFLLGNTFPFLVFMSFGSFYATYGANSIPSFGTYAGYSSDPVSDPFAGLATPQFNANYGFYWTIFTVLMFFFWLCCFRINVVFLSLFTAVVIGVALLAAVFFHAANGNAQTAFNCQIAAGACLFVACLIGWYLFAALVFPTVDFPLNLPLGDLSTKVPSLTKLRSGGGRKMRFGRKKNDGQEAAGEAVYSGN